jgi:transcriptional regulator with XRE-family HTH domain
MKAATNPIREGRKARGMTQEDLARAARVPAGRLSEYETGARKPSLASLYRIAQHTQPELAAALRPYVDDAA